VSEWKQAAGQATDATAAGPPLPGLPYLDAAVDHLYHWLGDSRPYQVDINFSPHEPYVDERFHQLWRQSFLQAAAGIDASFWVCGDPYGYLPLREQIQRYLSLERGIHVQVNQILLTSGAQHSLDLIAQALLRAGDTVTVEDPGFPAAWMAMKYRGMNVVPAPVDEYGLLVDRIHPRSKLVFVTPSHQCATGVIMAEPRRQGLLHLAASAPCWIVEDDYDSEFRYRGAPLPTLFSQQPRNTLYMLSFSKMIAPGIRLSAIVGSDEAISRLARVQQLTYRHLPMMEQLTLARFIARGHFMRHMRRVRNVYRRRHEAMTKAIMASGLGGRFTLSGVETGSHMLLEAENTYDEQTATSRALEQGIRVYPLSSYCLESNRKGWVLGFPNVDEAAIQQGIHRLADILI